jgi:hypothetical protein
MLSSDGVTAVANLRDFNYIISVSADDAAQLVHLAIFYHNWSCVVMSVEFVVHCQKAIHKEDSVHC